MAAVTAPQAPGTLTPPSSSSEGPSSWEFANNQNSTISKSTEYAPSNRQPLTTQSNAIQTSQTSRPALSKKRSNTYNSQHSAKSSTATDSGYLAPSRIGEITRKKSNISEANSGQDSLLDLYGTNSASRSALNSMDLGERKDLGNGEFAVEDDDDPEHSRWIHRDKLARIEREELKAAGIILPRTARSFSKTSRREESQEALASPGTKPELPEQQPATQPLQQPKRQQIAPTYIEEADDQEDSGPAGWDLRTPEEAAQDAASPSYKDLLNGVKGATKIPLSTTSLLPVPVEHLVRETPLLRSRSNGWVGEDVTPSKSKSRDPAPADDTVLAAAPGKRSVSDVSPSKKSNAATPRKASAPNVKATPSNAKSKQPRSRAPSSQRPPTRSGVDGGASSPSKAPEGDPPWLVNVYKPDPMLPPDQQLLPTVAKRLQQEKWEKDGKFGNAYDRDFRPLNNDVIQQPEVAEPLFSESDFLKVEDQPEWPLKGPKSPTLSTGRPGTAGGYSTMPKISQAPPVTMPTGKPQPLRLQEPPEEPKKAGCGCCIIM